MESINVIERVKSRKLAAYVMCNGIFAKLGCTDPTIYLKLAVAYIAFEALQEIGTRIAAAIGARRSP